MCSVQIQYDCFYLQVSEGLVLRDGKRLKYPINGMVEFAFMVSSLKNDFYFKDYLFSIFNPMCLYCEH